jgi:hypothetical protein
VAFVAHGDPGWRPVSQAVGMVFNETSGEQPVLEIERRLASAVVEAWPAVAQGADDLSGPPAPGAA